MNITHTVFLRVKMLKTLFLSVLMLVSAENSFSQVWEPFSDDINNPNFFQIQKKFYKYWENKTVERGKGYKPFKRWEWFWEQRVAADGSFPKPNFVPTEWANFQQNSSTFRNQEVEANWQSVGPNSSESGYDGIGRINVIAFHPTDKNIFFVGTPAGGLWKTSDFGATWKCLTEDLTSMGVSGIAVNPKNPSEIYIATGDTHATDTYSTGVLKSEDGGATWNTTGLTWTQNQTRQIGALIINPENPQIILAATSLGVYMTENSGTDWAKTSSFRAKDLRFKPGNPQIVYAASIGSQTANIFRSIDGGKNFTQVTAFNDVYRINLAVSTNAPEMVFAVAANAADYAFKALFVSENSGETFSSKFSSKNILGYSPTGSDEKGQGYYDLAIAVSNKDKNLIMIGGVNTWRSTDGGKTFDYITAWANGSQYNPKNKAIVHADKHFHAFHPLDENIMFQCNDGGLYYTKDDGVNWKDITNGMEITQFYRLSTSQQDPNMILAGAQDNGGRMRTGGKSWFQATGGDGMEVIIDHKDDNHCYSSYANGVLYYSPNKFSGSGTQTISDKIEGGSLEGAWVTPFIMSQKDPKVLFAGYNDVYKTTNRGTSWKKISTDLSKDRSLTSLAVAPTDDNVIYASSGKQLYATFNGGASWKSISVGLPVARVRLSYISVHPENPKILYVTFSGYSSNEKVYRSEDGGDTWENLSNGLPNLPANCVIFDKTKAEAVYMAMDIGIYYQENLTGTWAIYNHGLPNVPINEIEIQYSSQKIRAATYGRGVWESNLYVDPNNQPVPVITSFTPEEGNAGTSVSISGRNFDGANDVSFNGKKAEFSFVSTTSVKATVPAGATTGKITLTTPNGTATSENDFVIKEVAGFTENDFIRENVRVSPNPADNFVLIQLNNIPTGGELHIYDVLGRKIRTERIRGAEGKIDLSGLPAGNYRLKILTEKGIAQRSLIKN